MASTPLYPVGQFIVIPKGTAYYKTPIDSVKMGVTKKREYTVKIKKTEGSTTAAGAPHPYNVIIGDTKKNVWVNHKDVKPFNAEKEGSSGDAQSGGMEVIENEPLSRTNSLVGQIEANGYNTLVNDPMGTDAFTLSFKGRQLFEDDDQIKKVIENMGIIDRERPDEKDASHTKLYHQFDRNGCVDPYNGFVGAKSYIFFTRPDLHLFQDFNPNALNSELVGYPFFADIFDRYKDIMGALQSSCTYNDRPFINILTNTINSTIELPSISVQREVAPGSNAYGTTIKYRGTSHPSDEGVTFTAEFMDNRYLETFMLFKLYDEYEKVKWLGRVSPARHAYIIDKILSDQISIFRIDVAEDGESILYFCKWTGCIPLSVPTEALSDLSSITGNLTFQVNWHAQFFDDLDRDILSDFNAIVLKYAPNYFTADHKDIPIYDPVTGMANGEWASVPYIAVSEEANDGLRRTRLEKLRKYKLKWR